MRDLKENNTVKKKRYIVKGLFFILPALLTCWIIYKLVIFMSSFIPEYWIFKLLENLNINESYFNLIHIIGSFILTLIFLYIIGFLLSIFGRKFFNKIEKSLFYNIPIFSPIYKTIRQVTETISSPDKQSFKKVVMVQFPRKDLWTLGFVTGESKDKKDNEYYHVIVPTTPNPTSAYLLFILKDEVKETDISIDEGVKTIISGGVVAPDINHI